jgi:glycosyltransferase involved in cell wall biosynthesis
LAAANGLTELTPSTARVGGRTSLPPWRPTVGVVIPTLNEGQNVGYVVEALSGVDEVILVDGRSCDDTVAAAKAKCPQLQVVYQSGKGKGNALLEGFAASSADIVVTLDADGSADPAEIPRFIDALVAGAENEKRTRIKHG